jgi:hypothetical protein
MKISSTLSGGDSPCGVSFSESYVVFTIIVAAQEVIPAAH